MFQPLYYPLKRLGYTEKVISWKSKGVSAEKCTTPTTTDKWYRGLNFCLVFKGSA